MPAGFDRDSPTLFGGGNGGDAGEFIPVLDTVYVHNLSPNWKLGVSAGSFFGLGLDYDNDWAGRYYVQKAELLSLMINPVVAYRVNDWLSVGAGFSILYAELDQRSAINNVLDGLPDGRLKLEDDDVGFTLRSRSTAQQYARNQSD